MTGHPADPGSVSTGMVRPTEPGPEIKRLQVFIGRWLTEGALLDEAGAPSGRILASDVYDWAPGGFFVIHPAYGRIEELGVGGVEVIGYDPATGIYRCHFFDSQGNASEQTLAADGDTWLWEGEEARCTGIFSDGGRTLTAHHERRAADGWAPSMEVLLKKIN